MEPIRFMQYERISDDLYFLGNNVVLKFNVGLSYYKDGKRNFYHREYQYEKEHENVVSIKRSYDYYLSLENTSRDKKEFIMISPKDFPRFREAIQVVVSWFRDERFSKLFVSKKGKLILTSPIPTCEINGLPQGKYIKIDPVVIDIGVANDDKYPGISIELSDPNNYVNISVDTLIGFDYILSCVNMIQMAQSMLAALPVPMGTNRFNISDSPYGKNESAATIRNNNIDSKAQNGAKGIQGRFIGQTNKLEGL